MRYELPYPSTIFPAWLSEWMEVHKITIWGAADLRDFSTPRDEIEWWLRNRDSRRMFILLTAGDILWDPKIDDFDWKTTTALPHTLSGAFTAEPLYIETKRRVGNPIRTEGIVTDLVFHPNGTMLVIGRIYNHMVVWDLTANKKYLETEGISAAFSPDGTLLVTGGADNNGGRLNDLETGRAFGTIEEMPGSNPSITFSPGGELFAAASSDSTTRVWRRKKAS
jgi:WD40 repeat protein